MSKQKNLTVLELFDILRNSNPYQRNLSLFLALVYGLAVPLATLFLKEKALHENTFLFIENIEYLPIATIIFWILTIFSAAVSLAKVYEFLKVAFRNKIIAVLSCIAFEFAFITSNYEGFSLASLWLLFFFLTIAVANVTQATAGFISEEEHKKVSEKTNDNLDLEEDLLSDAPKPVPISIKNHKKA